VRQLRFLFLGALILTMASAATKNVFADTGERFHAPNMDETFETYRYPLGDFSNHVAKSLLGLNLSVEESNDGWNCSLEFAVPEANFVSWIHPASILCEHDDELHVWPLGEAEFKRAYMKHRLLLRGEVAQKLAKILNTNANADDVESPISTRKIAWGPARVLKITSLRRSSRTANLISSLECYTDENSEKLFSCAIESDE
jgi:hypothetical protein